jgi:hypothetical protein
LVLRAEGRLFSRARSATGKSPFNQTRGAGKDHPPADEPTSARCEPKSCCIESKGSVFPTSIARPHATTGANRRRNFSYQFNR